MSKNREFVSNVGTGADLLQKLAQAVYARHGTDDDLRRIISDESLRGRLADILIGKEPAKAGTYPVTVDRNRTPEEMVRAGRYDAVNTVINETDFPFSQPPATFAEICLELVYYHYDGSMTTKEVEADLTRRGLRPATMEELLAFGERYPDLQQEFLIIALGSPWIGPNHGHFAPCLRASFTHARVLDLHQYGPDSEWPSYCRFLAVRK